MFEPIWSAETTPSRLRCYFTLVSSTGHTAGATPTVTGVKVLCLKSNGTLFTSTNDIVAADAGTRPGLYYVQFTAGEVDTVGPIVGYLVPTGCDPTWIQCAVVPYNPWADGASIASIAAAILTTPANKLATDATGSVALGTASITALLNTAVETNGLVTMSMRNALCAAAALALGQVSGITDGTDAETFLLKSATGQTIGTVTGDALGNRTVSITFPS